MSKEEKETLSWKQSRADNSKYNDIQKRSTIRKKSEYSQIGIF